MDETTLLRVAGLAAVLAAPALALSGVALALFFGGKGDRWGPVNDVLIALALVLLAPAVVALDRLAGDVAGQLFTLVSGVALAGICLAAGGQLLLVAGRLSLQTSFLTGGIGAAAMLPWSIGVVLIAFTSEGVGDGVGVLLAASLALVLLTAITVVVTRGPMLWFVAGLLGVALSAWLLVLGLDLLGQVG